MPEIRFDEATHTYSLGKKKLISVTQLLKKHSLSPDYSNIDIDEEVLSRKAKRGSLIHKEIEDYIKTGEYGFSRELDEFIRIVEEKGMKDLDPERIFHDDLIAGTADLLATYIKKEGDKEAIVHVLVDYKTSAQVHFESCRWQLSLYERLSKSEIDELYVLHFPEDAPGRLIPIERIPAVEIEKLLVAERNEEVYSPPGLVVREELVREARTAEELVTLTEQENKKAVARRDLIRAKLYEAMIGQGVESFESEKLKITLVEPTVRMSLDSKKLRMERPDIAADYSKSSKVAGSVRITLRE